jgi:hypothetical protein
MTTAATTIDSICDDCGFLPSWSPGERDAVYVGP